MIYLELYHGRRDPEQDLDDWGEVGPVIACQETHHTYHSHIRLVASGNQEVHVWYFDDMIYFDGVWYGDFTITSTTPKLKEGQEILDLRDPKAFPAIERKFSWPKEHTPQKRRKKACPTKQ